MFPFILVLAFLSSVCISAMEGLTPTDFQRLQSIKEPRFVVVVKNVGQGSCTILKNKKNGRYYIIDAGTSGNAPVDVVNRVVTELAAAEVHNDLPEFVQAKLNIITSHADKDHINIFQRFFTLNGSFFNQLEGFILGDLQKAYKDKEDGQKLIRKIFDVMSETEKIMHINSYISDYSLPHGFLDAESTAISFLSILCANAGHDTSYHEDKNTNSAVVRFSINNHNILIMGDASAFTTRRYMIDPIHRETLKSAELLITSHHGAKDVNGSNDGLWLSQIRPKRVAISAGLYYNGHPDISLFQDLIMVDCLEDYVDSLATGFHKIFISIPQLTDLTYAKEQLDPSFKFMAQHEDNPKWSVFSTQKFIDNTASSGDLKYVFRVDGVLVNFLKDY